MSDSQLRRQTDEIRHRAQMAREAQMREAAAQAAERNRRHGR